MIAAGTTYGSVRIVTGAPTLAEGLGGCVPFVICAVSFALLVLHAVRHRVVLDGRFLWHRHAFGWRGPVDVGRLRTARLKAMGTGRYDLRVRALEFRDRDRRTLVVDRVHGDLEPLYRELARRFATEDPIFDRRLAKKVDRFRDPPEA